MCSAPALLERRDVRSREPPRAVRVAGVRVQRAAALLARRVASANSRSRAARAPSRDWLGEQAFHHAPGEQRDGAARAVRRRRLGRGRRPRSRASSAASPSRIRRGRAAATARRAMPVARITRPPAIARRMSHGCSNTRQNHARDERNRPMLGERRARGLEQMPVRNARRTHRLARAAAEALRDVRLDALVRPARACPRAATA